MSDTKQFLDEMMPRIHEAETALLNGDAGPRLEMWSHTDPVTVFGAAIGSIGWPGSVRCSRSSPRASPTAFRASGKWWPPT